jgi:hypothetical protein
MKKASVSHSTAQCASFRKRFEDMVEAHPYDVSSFFFDLKLLLPPGMTAADTHRARLAVERRLQRTIRKKDRIVWTADGFFLMLATTDPARAGAVAERVHQDVCAVLAGAGAIPVDTAVRVAEPDEYRRAPFAGAEAAAQRSSGGRAAPL